MGWDTLRLVQAVLIIFIKLKKKRVKTLLILLYQLSTSTKERILDNTENILNGIGLISRFQLYIKNKSYSQLLTETFVWRSHLPLLECQDAS